MRRIEVETLPHTKVRWLLRMVIHYKKLLELFKGGKQMNGIKTSCAPPDQKGETWKDIDWNKCHHQVRKLQGSIVKAQLLQWNEILSRFLNRNFELLEPYEGKLSCTVLWGGSGSNAADLLDSARWIKYFTYWQLACYFNYLKLC